MQKKLFYTVFTIEGLNRERFFNTLQKKGITAHNLKTLGAKKTEFAIDSEDLKKFFANFNNGQYSFLKGEFRSYWRTSCQITEKNSKVGKIRKTERSDF